MIHQVWNGDYGKYVSDESACCCWRKADILSVTWNYVIINNVGSEKLEHSKKCISDDICNDLCNLMAQVKVKTHPWNDTYIAPEVINSYFVVDPKCSTKDMEDMVSTWVIIEDDRDSVDAIFD